MIARRSLAFFYPIVFTLFFIAAVFGQDADRFTPVAGLSASIQGSQVDILLPIWVSKLVSIAPAVGIISVESGGTDLRIGIEPRYFFYKEKFGPYVGAKIGFLSAEVTGGPSTTDWLYGIASGGEYFLDDHFSFGVEGQLNATKSDPNSDRFGNPGKWTLNTSAAVFATVYF